MRVRKLFAAIFPALIILVSLDVEISASDEGMEILKNRCVACHDIDGPAPKTVKELWQRKAPDLFYGGLKYKPDWLASWLQKPERLRPAGYRFFMHIEPVKGRSDNFDKDSLKPHIALTKKEAVLVASTVMTLKRSQNLPEPAALGSGEIDEYMEKIKFRNSLGCLSCHKISPDEGGFTGPELYTAGKRLQTDFLVSYLKNPQAWDPKTAMPNGQMGENSIRSTAKYIIFLSSEDNYQ